MPFFLLIYTFSLTSLLTSSLFTIVYGKEVEKLKETIVTEWTKLSQRFIDRAIDQGRRRLQCVVQQQGGHIEHFM